LAGRIRFMEISYLGGGSVRLSGKQINLLCDPIASGKADVVTLSQPEMKNPATAKMVLDGPGEYEIQNSLITGVPARLHIDEAGERGTMYVITVDGVNVLVTGNIAPGLSDSQVEAIGDVDVLVVPVGGHGLTLDATGAVELVSRLEPKYVVPVHFDDGKTKYEMPQEGVENFLKEMGASPEPESKFKVSAKEMPLETTVVVLKRSE
jgi:L-ascorbate metabolism protein UlaG (beta-lactamase superfamily)